MYKRSLDLHLLKDTFFLWGPRQTGKSSLLRAAFPNAFWIDLLKTDEYIKYTESPHRLREEASLLANGSWVVIDEIQKVPTLLDEIHWLIENRGLRFALCGSSARRVRRGHANLLGGRAIRRELSGLTARELGGDFDLIQMLNRGYLPRVYQSDFYRDLLRSYVSDYLKEEIMAEGLVRDLPKFSSFLHLAALSDTEVIEYTTFARDVGVSSPTIKSYFEILEDTLIGSFLQAYRKRAKRRVQLSPKFYFFDVGVVNHLANRGEIAPRTELMGKAFENWVFHEIRSYRAYKKPDLDIRYWKLSGGIEVDFVLNDLRVCIEAKATAKIHADHLKGLREIKKEFANVGERWVVSLEKTSRQTEDGIMILSPDDFVARLWES